MNYNQIGEKLREYRIRRGLSLREVAAEMKRIDPTGKGASHAWVDETERGTQKASLYKLWLFGRVVGVDVLVNIVPENRGWTLVEVPQGAADAVAALWQREEGGRPLVASMLRLLSELEPDQIETLIILAGRLTGPRRPARASNLGD